MSIKSTQYISRQTAIERIRRIDELIRERKYRTLQVETFEEQDFDFEAVCDNHICLDDVDLDAYTNTMLEHVMDKPLFRKSIFDNYRVVPKRSRLDRRHLDVLTHQRSLSTPSKKNKVTANEVLRELAGFPQLYQLEIEVRYNDKLPVINGSLLRGVVASSYHPKMLENIASRLKLMNRTELGKFLNQRNLIGSLKNCFNEPWIFGKPEFTIKTSN